MARRTLTRIELRMEDLQEYEQAKKQHEKSKHGMDNSFENSLVLGGSTTHFTSSLRGPGHTRETIHERIGYNPTIRNPH